MPNSLKNGAFVDARPFSMKHAPVLGHVLLAHNVFHGLGFKGTIYGVC